MLPSRAVAAIALALYVVDVEAGLGDPQSENRSATTKFKHTMHQAIVTDSPEKGESLPQDHSQRGHEDNTQFGESLLQDHSQPVKDTLFEATKTRDRSSNKVEERSTSEERHGVFGHEGGPGPLFGKAKKAADKQFEVAGRIAEKGKNVQRHMTDAATSLHHYHKAVLGLNENLKELDTVQELVNPLFKHLKDEESETVEPLDDKHFEKYMSALAKAQEDLEERISNDEDE